MKTIVALALMALSAGAFAQINKCVDANGKVVGYGECPPGTRSEASGVRSSPAPAAAPSKSGSAPAAGPKSAAEKDADFRKRQMEKQEAATKAEKKMAEAADQKRTCEDARSYLKALRDRQPVTRTDPKTGERVYFSDSDYPKEIARAERAVSQSCM